MTLTRRKKLWYLPDGTTSETYQPGATSDPFGIVGTRERFEKEQQAKLTQVKETTLPAEWDIERSLRQLYPEQFKAGALKAEDPFKTTENLFKQVKTDAEKNPQLFLDYIKKQNAPEETKNLLKFLGARDDEEAEDIIRPPTDNRLIATIGKIPEFATSSIDEILKEIETAPDAFLQKLRVGGITPAKRDLMRMMGFDEATITQIIRTPYRIGEIKRTPVPERNPPIVSEELGYKPPPLAKDAKEREERAEAFRAYRKAGGKMFADQWELYGMPATPAAELPKLSKKERQAVIDRDVQRHKNLFAVFGKSLTYLPKQLGASILQAIQGQSGASVVEKDWADKFITDAGTDLEKFTQEILDKYGESDFPIKLSDIATLPQNIAYSLTSMGAGLAVGVPVALAPVPGARVAAWGLGSAASGAVAYSMTTYQIMQQYLEVKDAEMRSKSGRGLTAKEEADLKAGFETKAREYGLWEAVPEAISNLAFGKILTAPLSRVAGRSIAVNIVKKLVGMYGEEFLTETITQKGQSDVEIAAGLREGRLSWVEAFKQVAPQTFLLTTILGGAGQVSVSSFQKIKQSFSREAGDSAVFEDINKKIAETVFDEVEADAKAAKVVAEPVTPEVSQVEAVKETAKDIFTRAAKSIEETPEQKAITKKITELEGRYNKLSAEAKARTPKGQLLPDADLAELKRITTEAESLVKERRLLGRPPVIPPVTPAAPEVTKEPWQMTRAEFVERGTTRTALSPEMEHRGEVFAALRDGKPVPTEVLKDYPNMPRPIALPKAEAVSEAEIWTSEIEPKTKKGYYWKVFEKGKQVASNYEPTKREAQNRIGTLIAYYKTTTEGKELIEEARGKIAPEAPAVVDYQEAIDEGVPPDQRPPDPAQAIIPPDPVPSYPDMPKDSEIKRIITQSEEQVRQDQPKAITNLLHKLPGVRQLLEVERPGLKMTGEKQKILVALVAEQQARSDVSVWAMSTRLQLLAELRDVFGKDVLRGAKSEIKFLGTPEQASNPITGTLLDIAQNPELYELTPRHLGALASIEVHNDTMLNWVVENYGAEIGHFTPKPDGAYLPNVDKSEDVVEWLGSEMRTITQGRGKTRIWQTMRDRMGGKTPVDPQLDVQKLLEGLDTSKASAAAGQTYKAAIGGLTKLEAIEQTHPDLFKRMTSLRKELSSLKGSTITIESNIHTAIDEFLNSPVEDADLLNLKDQLDVRLKAGKRKGMDMTAIQDRITVVQDQIDEIRPAWQAANLKPYVFIQQGLYRYFPSDQAKLILESLATTDNRLLGIVEKWRGQAFSGDFSPFTIQGVIGVLADPYGSLKAGLGSIRSAIQHGDFLRSVRIEALADDIANNPVEWGEYASLMGRSLTGTPKEYAAGFLSKIPGFDKFTENTFVTVTRGSFNLWKRNYTNMVKHGVPVLEAKVAAADIASKVYPLVSQTRLGQSQARHTVLRALPTSYSFIRQSLNLTADALRGMGKIATGQTLSPSESLAVKVAITGAASTLAVSATSAFLSAKALGKDDDEAWQTALDAINPHPMNGKFASIIIGNVRIPLGGPYRALFRAMYPSEVKGVPFPVPFAGLPNYLKNRITPALSTQLDLLLNKDYSGQQIVKGAFPENVLRFLEYEFENFLPLMAGTAAEALRLGDKYREPMWQQVLGQFMGVNPVTLDNTYIDRQIKQLGMEKEGEAKPFVIQKLEYFSTKDLYGDISAVLKRRTGEGFKDKPLTLAIKEAMELKKTANGLLNRTLSTISDDDWALLEARQDLEDTTEFDEQHPDLANVTQRQYALLREYRSLTDKTLKAQFLKDHPELAVNPRQEWWKSNPKENALLAVFGQADLLTPEAYTEFKRLVKELDIPDNALPPRTLPPEGSLDIHWKREQMVADGKEGSWEGQLLLEQDYMKAHPTGKVVKGEPQSYAEWKGLKLSDTPIASLELKVKNADNLRLLDSSQPNSFGDKDGLNYKDDKEKDKNGLTERDRARQKLYKDNPGLYDDESRIEAIEVGTKEKPTDPKLVDAHVQFKKILAGQEEDVEEGEEPTLEVTKAKLFRVDNEGYDGWRTSTEIDGRKLKPIDKTMIPKWRLDVQYEKEDKDYKSITEKHKGIAYANETLRDNAIRADQRKFQEENIKWRLDNFRRDAYTNKNKDTGYKLPGDETEDYVAYKDLIWQQGAFADDKAFYGEDRFLLANDSFRQAMYALTGTDKYKNPPAFVPPIQYDELGKKHTETYALMKRWEDETSPDYLDNSKKGTDGLTDRQRARQELSYRQSEMNFSGVRVTFKQPTDFKKDDIKREGMLKKVPEQFLDTYVKWQSINTDVVGKPKDWEERSGTELWFEDEWFMLENPDFYQVVHLEVLGKDRMDFRKVPMTEDGKPNRAVFEKYLDYNNIVGDYWQDLYRWNNTDMELWAISAGIWKTSIRQDKAMQKRMGMTPQPQPARIDVLLERLRMRR